MVDTGQFTIKCQGDGRVIALTANVVGDTPFHLHRVSKHVPPLACYNFDTRVRIFDIFGRNSTNKLMNQKMLYYASSNNLCFCITWQNGKLKKIAFFTRSISALPEFNPSLLDFFSLFDSRLILALLYDSMNLVINAFSLRLLGGTVQEEGSREGCSSWAVLHA